MGGGGCGLVAMNFKVSPCLTRASPYMLQNRRQSVSQLRRMFGGCQWPQLLPSTTPPSLLPGQGGHYMEIFLVLHHYVVEGLNFNIDATQC